MLGLVNVGDSSEILAVELRYWLQILYIQKVTNMITTPDPNPSIIDSTCEKSWKKKLSSILTFASFAFIIMTMINRYFKGLSRS